MVAFCRGLYEISSTYSQQPFATTKSPFAWDASGQYVGWLLLQGLGAPGLQQECHRLGLSYWVKIYLWNGLSSANLFHITEQEALPFHCFNIPAIHYKTKYNSASMVMTFVCVHLEGCHTDPLLLMHVVTRTLSWLQSPGLGYCLFSVSKSCGMTNPQTSCVRHGQSTDIVCAQITQPVSELANNPRHIRSFLPDNTACGKRSSALYIEPSATCVPKDAITAMAFIGFGCLCEDWCNELR